MVSKHTDFLHIVMSPQIVFRKIVDVKKEEEERRRQKNEVTLSIPVDHPVRKLFQKFRQQKEMRTQSSSQHDLEKNQFQVEHHLHPLSHQMHQQQYQPQYQGQHPLQHQHVAPVQNGALGSGNGNSGSSVVTVSQITPIQSALAYVQTEEPNRSEGHKAMELKPSFGVEDSNCLKVTSPVRPRGGKGRGWMRFQNIASGSSPMLQLELEKQPQQKEEEVGDVSQPLNVISKDGKSQEAEGGRSNERGPGGNGNSSDETDENSALHKTDSCDSGITKSDLRIDQVGDSRSPYEISSMERSPYEQPSPGEGDMTLRGIHFHPLPEQTALQNSLYEAKLELKGDIQTLNSRLAALEDQVGEILRLLLEKRKPSPPPQNSSPKNPLQCQDIFDVSQPVTPETEGDNGPLWIRINVFRSWYAVFITSLPHTQEGKVNTDDKRKDPCCCKYILACPAGIWPANEIFSMDSSCLYTYKVGCMRRWFYSDLAHGIF